jgi:hypothetical protein
VKSSLSTIAAGAAIFLAGLVPIEPASKVAQFLWIGIRVSIGAVAYLGIAFLLGLPEVRGTLERLNRRFVGKSSKTPPLDG